MSTRGTATAEERGERADRIAWERRRVLEAHEAVEKVARGLLDFVRARFPDDFVEGGPGFSCEHHRAVEAALQALDDVRRTGGES